MARHGPEYVLRGAILRRACRVGGGAVLVPGRRGRRGGVRRRRRGRHARRAAAHLVVGSPARELRARRRRRAARTLALSAEARLRSVNESRARLGVVGLGYWGPNLGARFHALPDCELAWCCDERPRPPGGARGPFRSARFDRRDRDLLGIRASTRSCSRRRSRRTRRWRSRCSRPASTASSRSRSRSRSPTPSASSLAAAARPRADGRPSARVPPGGPRAQGRSSTPGELGELRYIYSNRLNLGQLRADENALWSLGAHDVSVVLALAGEEPNELQPAASATFATASRTSCSRSCGSPRASPRTCT